MPNRRVANSIAVAAASALALAGCSAGSTAPQPAPIQGTLALSAETVTLMRGESLTLRALYTPPGGSEQDVTSSATWTSSSASVASVDGGVIRIAGLGQATVQVTYSGIQRAIVVTGRRRLGIYGEVVINNADGRSSMSWVPITWDGTYINSMNASGIRPVASIPLPKAEADFDVSPGNHELIATIYSLQPEQPYVTGTTSRIVLYDRDSGADVLTLPLAVQSVVVANGGTLKWTLTVPVISQ